MVIGSQLTFTLIEAIDRLRQSIDDLIVSCFRVSCKFKSNTDFMQIDFKQPF